SFRYLVRRRRSSIGFVTRPAEMRERGLGSAMRLLEGYERSRATFSCVTALHETELDAARTASATRSLIEELPDLDAIVATHGRSTVGIIRALESSGRRVPDDVNVISIATRSIAEMTTPPLTSIHFPSEEMGYEAARMLIDRIAGDGRRTPRHVLFDPKLVLRGTTSD
ncbi:MAG: substrate-binding domain-containing protein, partial [Spirochaetales bacterium]|nr:substrate-binding domain-containing protein [Spirochaetales bacterium]